MPGLKVHSNSVDLERPTIFAHRGSSAHAPENTLAAFKLALDQRADGIELDVKLSADGQIIVMHDDAVDRTTNGTGRVKSLTLRELKQLDAGSKFDPKYQGERIPTLAEVFETVGQQVLINVELTNYSSTSDDLPDKVVALVKDFKLEENMILSSYNIAALCKARFKHSTLPLGVLVFSGTASAILHSRLLRFGPLLALHPSTADCTPQLVEDANLKNCRIRVYTVNQPDIMRQMYSYGVDGIFTDDPLLAQQAFTESRS